MAMVNNQMVSLYGISSMVFDDFRWFLMICVSLFYEGLCFEVGQHQQGSSDLGPRSWQSHGPLSWCGQGTGECLWMPTTSYIYIYIYTYSYLLYSFIYLFIYLCWSVSFLLSWLLMSTNPTFWSQMAYTIYNTDFFLHNPRVSWDCLFFTVCERDIDLEIPHVWMISGIIELYDHCIIGFLCLHHRL